MLLDLETTRFTVHLDYIIWSVCDLIAIARPKTFTFNYPVMDGCGQALNLKDSDV